MAAPITAAQAWRYAKPLAPGAGVGAGTAFVLNKADGDESTSRGLTKVVGLTAVAAGIAVGVSALMRKSGNFGNLQAYLGAVGSKVAPPAAGAWLGAATVNLLHDAD